MRIGDLVEGLEISYRSGKRPLLVVVQIIKIILVLGLVNMAGPPNVSLPISIFDYF